jgi:hypothetical protein
VEWVEKGERLPFDLLLATPTTVSMFRQHGRILGPKGLMPNEKHGTIVHDIESYMASYMSHQGKGIDLNLDAPGTTSRGATLRVVVGKVLTLTRNNLMCSLVKKIRRSRQI